MEKQAEQMQALDPKRSGWRGGGQKVRALYEVTECLGEVSNKQTHFTVKVKLENVTDKDLSTFEIFV